MALFKTVVAADYASVKSNISAMEKEVEEILNQTQDIIKAVEEAKDWIGPDAIAYKLTLKTYSSKIRNSAAWLKTLDRTISNHAERLYERALRDSKASSFRG